MLRVDRVGKLGREPVPLGEKAFTRETSSVRSDRRMISPFEWVY